MTIQAQSTTTETTPNFTMHPAMALGHVHYTVADLDKQIGFYQDVLGFKLHWRDSGSAGLGGGELGNDLLRLTQHPDARPARGTTGLYHTAFLVPSRWELAHLLRQVAMTRTRIQGMVDHHTHLAIYLPDAEGNGIELAWDRPKDEWPPLADMIMLGNGPLEPEELFAEIERDTTPWTGLNPASVVGHVHLHVGDLSAGQRFYHGVLGLDTVFVEQRFGAGFYSAGGYHHHIGTNVWHGVGAPPPPPNATGLLYLTMRLPDPAEVQRLKAHLERSGSGLPVEQTEQGVFVSDPFQNRILLTDRP